jgi:ankyrin repeat protein
MIKQFPPEILNLVVPYLEMDDISHLIQTCREFSESLTVIREIIKATKNNSIYERAELLQIAYKNNSNLVIDWEEIKLELKKFHQMSNAVILRAKNSIIKFKNWDQITDIEYKLGGINWTGVWELLYSNPNLDHTKALIFASRFGAIDLVPNMLLESRIDPAYDRNNAICWASYSGHLEIVRLLLNDSRVDPQ